MKDTIDNSISNSNANPELVSAEAFCKQIHYSDPRYMRISDLFVRPQSYEKIVGILNKYHIVCITGDPFMGKSYTALYLLYQLFAQGFEVQKPEIRELNDVVIHLLHSLESSLVGEKAIYIEDPFGQEHYNRFHELTSEFTKLADAVSKSDSRIIITSRSEIFAKGLEFLVNSDQVQRIRVDLKLGADPAREAAYSQVDLQAILEKYIKLYRPLWAKDQNLTNRISSQALAELQAPPSLEFFVSTYRNETTVGALVRGIQNSRSKNIIPAFAQEIAESRLPEVAFWLLFDVLREDLAGNQRIFESRVQPALASESSIGWNEYLRKHREKFTEYHYAGNVFWKFYHPFLIEAISYAINEFSSVDGVLGLIYDLLVGEKNPFLLVDIADSILRRIATTSHARLRILERLIVHENYLVRAGIAASLVKYLVQVEGAFRPRVEEMLLKVANDNDTWVRRNIAVAIAQNYESISRVSPGVVKIFHDLSQHPDPNVRYAVAEAVLWYYKDVPQLHVYLWRQADDKDPLARGLFADAIIWQFPVLSQSDQTRALDIIQKYANSDTDQVRGWLKTALAWHWDSLQELPQETLDGIWQSMSNESSVVSRAAADHLEWHYRYFENYKPQFIGTLTSKVIRPTEYSGIMQTLFWGADPHPFPQHIEAYFARLAHSTDPRVRGWSAFAFSVRYSQFSAENRKILEDLVSDASTETRRIAAQCMAANYSRAPELMQSLLERLALDSDPDVRLGVVEAAKSLGSEVPSDQRERLRSLTGISQD